MRYAGRSEWTKLRTDSGNGWLFLGFVVLTLAVGAAVVMNARCDAPGCGEDATKLSLSGVMVGQVVVAVVAVLMVGNEYGTGMMQTTVAAVPRRLAVLFSKAAVLGAVTLVAGAIGVFGSLLIGRTVQPGQGFTEAHGYEALSPADSETLRAAVGSVLYLVLIGLLGLGIGLIVRSSATAIGTVLGLLFFFPILTQVITDPDWQRFLQQIAPMTAGLSVQTTIGVDQLPIGPWEGLGVVALWASGALAVGGVMLRTRDV